MKERQGRPTSVIDALRVNIYLDPQSFERAKFLSYGNLSDCIRRSLARNTT